MRDIIERLHMNNLCESIIQIDRQIKFVCIVNENAKLLAGISRPAPKNYNILDTSETNKSPIHSKQSKLDDLIKIHFKYRNMYLFYSDYLLWVIRSCTSHLYDTRNKDNSCITQITNKSETFFELSGLDSDNVKLMVKPLNIRTLTFLCIYFEPPYSIKSSVADANKRFKNLVRKIYIIASMYSNLQV